LTAQFLISCDSTSNHDGSRLEIVKRLLCFIYESFYGCILETRTASN
jgi:hypothetical protein